MAGTRALVALEDGTVFEGTSLGAAATIAGEVCFNTGMTGYQEILTDPSYHGQIVTMTAPHIGNTGVNNHDDQSRRPWVTGFVVRDASMTYSSWRGDGSLDDYLRRHGVPALTDVDTRALTRHIRMRGAMRAALSTEAAPVADDLVDVARSSAGLVGRDLAREVTTERAYAWGTTELARRAVTGYAAGAERAAASRELVDAAGEARRVAAFDFGIKRNILDLLVAAGFEVTVVPATTPAWAVVEGGFDGVFLSNGPGDPEPVHYGVDTVRELLGRLPIFGICLGHQILGLAVGGRTFKLPFGHRGGNHPVRRLDSGRVEITCQNHGFGVDAESLRSTDARVTHVNLNDGTIEGLVVPGAALSVQYHPEAGPGPHDSRYLFGMFRDLIETFVEPVQASARAGV